VAAGPVIAFAIAVAASLGSAAAGFHLCRLPIVRSRRLLSSGSRATASIVKVVPKHPAGQEFPSDSARIVVEYEAQGCPHRETILLMRTPEERYHVGDDIEVLISPGRSPRARTSDEPNVCYGTTEQIIGASLLILAALPYFIMLSAHALTP
jgi:hypothetical protein